MRGFRTDPSPQPGWSADWSIEDRYDYLPADAEVHLRYTDLTTGVEAGLAEAWVMTGMFNTTWDAWIPRVMVRRRTDDPPLISTFVAVIESYARESNIRRIHRLGLRDAAGEARPDGDVAVMVELPAGRRDLIIAPDAEGFSGNIGDQEQTVLHQTETGVSLEGEMAFVRWGAEGEIRRIALARGCSLQVADLSLRLSNSAECVELRIKRHRATVASGNAGDITMFDESGRRIVVEP